jgi:Zyg-11 family protein
MMGLLGNVAEVEELRPQLMTSEFITVFSDLLYSTSDGIEVRVLSCRPLELD